LGSIHVDNGGVLRRKYFNSPPVARLTCSLVGEVLMMMKDGWRQKIPLIGRFQNSIDLLHVTYLETQKMTTSKSKVARSRESIRGDRQQLHRALRFPGSSSSRSWSCFLQYLKKTPFLLRFATRLSEPKDVSQQVTYKRQNSAVQRILRSNVARGEGEQRAKSAPANLIVILERTGMNSLIHSLKEQQLLITRG
jgi:hypothetical protein